MNTKDKINAALYARVSTQRQVLEGFSLDAQKENLYNFAITQGWNVYDSYVDEGVSGKNIQDRKEVKRLIEDIKNKKIDIVVLYKFDRLTRDSRDTEDFMELIQTYGILVYALSGGIVDVSSPSGRFNTRILGAAAQFERETMIDRIVDGLIKKVKNGYSLCGARPSYGYNRPKHQEIQSINEEEAKVVRRVFNLYKDGKTLTEICNILNGENIRPKEYGKLKKYPNREEYHVVNSVWQPKTIQIMLSNVNYIGMVRYGVGREQVTLEAASNYQNRKKGFIAQGLHEPIIDMETWNKVQDRLSKKVSIQRTNIPKNEVYYCGFLVCGFCGNRLTTQRTIKKLKDGTTNTHLGYRCVNREKGLCPAIGMSHKKVESEFIKYIERITELEDINQYEYNNEDIAEKDNEKNAIKKRLSQKNNKIKEVMKLFMDDKLNYDEYQSMKEELEKQCNDLKIQLESFKDQSIDYQKIDCKKISKNIKDHWQELTDVEKREFLTRFIKKIVIVKRSSNAHTGFPEIIKVEFYEE